MCAFAFSHKFLSLRELPSGTVGCRPPAAARRPNRIWNRNRSENRPRNWKRPRPTLNEMFSAKDRNEGGVAVVAGARGSDGGEAATHTHATPEGPANVVIQGFPTLLAPLLLPHCYRIHKLPNSGSSSDGQTRQLRLTLMTCPTNVRPLCDARVWSDHNPYFRAKCNSEDHLCFGKVASFAVGSTYHLLAHSSSAFSNGHGCDAVRSDENACSASDHLIAKCLKIQQGKLYPARLRPLFLESCKQTELTDCVEDGVGGSGGGVLLSNEDVEQPDSSRVAVLCWQLTEIVRDVQEHLSESGSINELSHAALYDHYFGAASTHDGPAFSKTKYPETYPGVSFGRAMRKLGEFVHHTCEGLTTDESAERLLVYLRLLAHANGVAKDLLQAESEDEVRGSKPWATAHARVLVFLGELLEGAASFSVVDGRHHLLFLAYHLFRLRRAADNVMEVACGAGRRAPGAASMECLRSETKRSIDAEREMSRVHLYVYPPGGGGDDGSTTMVTCRAASARLAAQSATESSRLEDSVRSVGGTAELVCLSHGLTCLLFGCLSTSWSCCHFLIFPAPAPSQPAAD